MRALMVALCGIPLTLGCSTGGEVAAGGAQAPSGGGSAQASAPAAPPAGAPAAPSKGSDAGGGIHLQALSATSGAGADALLDGDPKSRWSPQGDPADEGFLLRFEAPTPISAVTLEGCGGASVPGFVAYVDGNSAGGELRQPAAPRRTLALFPDAEGAARPARSLFIKLGPLPTGPAAACVSEVKVAGAAGAAIPLRPPRAVDGQVRASSVLSPADAYHPGYLFDQRTDFGWVEGAKGTGGGESLTLTLSAPHRITALQLWNGYQRSGDHFKKNARIKALTLSTPEGASYPLTVADTMGPQTLTLPEPLTTAALTLKIDDVFPGSRYADLVISELRLVDDEGPFTVRTGDMAARQAALTQEIASGTLARIVDTRWAPACEGGEEETLATEGSLKLRSNHSFARYDRVTDLMDDSAVAEVFDGAWVVADQGKPWSTIKLYGRRHQISESWSPYTGKDTTEATRVSGGDARIARAADLGEAGMRALLKDWQAKGIGTSLFECPQFDPADPRFATAFKGLVDASAFVVEGPAMVGVYAKPR